MGSSTPHARPEHHHRARRRGTPRSLLSLNAPDSSRRACAFFRCRASRWATQMPRVRLAPARGYRLPDKLPPALPRVAWWVGATPTRPRCPSACGIARTAPPPCSQPRKALAIAAARALPDPLKYHRPTASSSYLPLAPPALLAIFCGLSFLRLEGPARSLRWHLPLQTSWGSQ